MMCLYARCLCMMQSWSDMLKTAVMDLLQSHTSIDFHFLKPYIQEQRSSADFWKHPAYDEGILFLKVFLKRAEHTFSSYISHCICFKNQFWEHPSLWAAERSFTTGSANHILRKLQQILPIPLCCHAPDTNGHRSLLLFLVRALVPCMHGAAWAPSAGLRRSVSDCLAAAQQRWQPRCSHLISTLYLVTLKVKINSNIPDLHERSWGQGEQSPLPSPFSPCSTNPGACKILPNTGCLCAGLWKKRSNCYARVILARQQCKRHIFHQP